MLRQDVSNTRVSGRAVQGIDVALYEASGIGFG